MRTHQKLSPNEHLSRFVIVVLAILLVLQGCTKDPYRAAIQGSSDVSEAVSSAIKISAAYYNAGTFSDAQKATAAKYLEIVTDCNTAFRKSVQFAHDSGKTGASAYLPIADTLVTCVKSFGPPTVDQKVFNVIKAVDTAITGISLAIADAKTKQ